METVIRSFLFKNKLKLTDTPNKNKPINYCGALLHRRSKVLYFID